MNDDPDTVSSPDPHSERLNAARDRMAAVSDEDKLTAGRPSASRPPINTLLQNIRVFQDRKTNKLIWGSAGAIGLLVLGAASWSLIGHHQEGIPVFAPPPGPVRDKPANPGGMSLGISVPDETTADGKTHLLPPPEQPDPQALAAKLGVAEPPADKKPVTPAATPPASTDTDLPEEQPAIKDVLPPNALTHTAENGDRVTDMPLPAVPPPVAEIPSRIVAPGTVPDKPKSVATKKPVTEPTPPVTKPEVSSAPQTEPTGHYIVQLAALNSESGALQEWERLKASVPDMLSNHTPLIQRVQHDNAIFYRLRTQGFASIAEARDFCIQMRTHGHACTPLRP
ncbi:MAG: SPOR domain-containing protein [Acetobacter sp.]|jgi:hypothetical protein